MKLFIDDLRSPPDSSWHVVKTAEEAMEFITKNKVDEISFDHDLGDPDALTGYDVAKWLEEQVYTDQLEAPKKMYVHSANPVGAKRIKQAIQSIERYKNLI
jgi:hypothetical protein